MKFSKVLSFILTFAVAAPLLCSCGGSGKGIDTSGDTTQKPTASVPDLTYKRVVLLGVDGAGNFFRETDTPNMDEIFKDGATNYNVLTASPTISAECWGSMLIGCSASAHGLTNGVVSGQRYPADSSLPTVFRRIREALPDAVLASACNWDPINYGIVEEDLGVFKDTNSDDGKLTEQILTYLDKNDPTFLFVQFDNVDGAGHANGYGKPGHLEQITLTDDYIGQIWEKYSEKGWLEDTLFIVTADHGGTPGGSHGGLTDAEKYVFFGLAGKNVKAGTFGDMNIRDTAAIVLTALGLDVPEFDLNGFSAQVPDGIFEGYTPSERQPLSVDNVHETLPTPTPDSGKYLTDFIPADMIDVALFFDKTTDCSIGDTGVTVTGTPKFYDYGYYGSNIEVGKQGHLSLDGYTIGPDSFAISLWFYYDRSVSDSDNFVLYSNDDFANGGKGISMTLSLGSLNLRLSSGQMTENFSFIIPETIGKGWLNTTLVIDRDNGSATHYFNFASPEVVQVSSSIIRRKDSLESRYDFTIGCDGATVSEPSVNIMMDDFLFLSGTVDAELIAKLASYYGLEN